MKLKQLLVEMGYNKKETSFLVKSFKYGFDLGYRGDRRVKKRSPNLKITVGSEVQLWNKIMKEVKLKRFAGPFEKIPFEYYIQSPVGLVSKDNGKDTRLIFHLSFPRSGKSVNSETPRRMCKVRYKDFSEAIKRCVEEGIFCFIAKSDMKSAFRNLGISRNFWKFLILYAKSPIDGKIYFFVDKCLPFGASISCSHFQRFSDAIAHITKVKNGNKLPINYLDDFLFCALLCSLCNQQVRKFLEICELIKFPVSMEKTVWGTQFLTFLGLLIDTVNQVVCILVDKVERAKFLISEILSKRTVTVEKLQKLSGFLNFLCKCVVPGRTFVQRLYYNFSSQMKSHYHININGEIKQDLLIWQEFLNNPQVYCRPFMDFSEILQADKLNWYTDASGKIGAGGIWNQRWYQLRWTSEFLERYKPSIEYLELFAVMLSVVMWLPLIPNSRICLFTDNTSVRDMINDQSTRCRSCMMLIRQINLTAMTCNTRVFAEYVESKSNSYADALSRFQDSRFWKLAEEDGRIINDMPDTIPDKLLPSEKFMVVRN